MCMWTSSPSGSSGAILAPIHPHSWGDADQHVAKGSCQPLLRGEARVCFYTLLGLNVLVQSVDLVQCLQDNALPTLSLFENVHPRGIL